MIDMFSIKALDGRVTDRDLYSFLMTETIIKEDPWDYIKDTEFAGENSVITLRMTQTTVTTIHKVTSWAKRNGLMVSNLGSSALLKKIYKHGALLVADDPLIKEFLELDEKRLKYMDAFSMKTSKHYTQNYSLILRNMIVKYRIMSDSLNDLFRREPLTKINFRAQPRWISTLTKIAYAIGTTSYQMHRIAMLYSLSTIGDTEPHVDEVREVLSELLEEQKNDIKILSDIYKEVTGDDL